MKVVQIGVIWCGNHLAGLAESHVENLSAYALPDALYHRPISAVAETVESVDSCVLFRCEVYE